MEASLLAVALGAIIVGSLVSVNYGIQANRAAAKSRASEKRASQELARANEHARQLREMRCVILLYLRAKTSWLKSLACKRREGGAFGECQEILRGACAAST